MKQSCRFAALSAGALALAAIAVPAIAGYGKAGLWNITTTINLGAGMPDLSKLPPELQAQAQAALRAQGITMNGNTMSVQHCMTPAEVSAGHPDVSNLRQCQMSNMRQTASGFSADVGCSGQISGTGHVAFNFDSAEHYTGRISIVGTAQGRAVNTTTALEGRWVSADCKGVTH